MSRRLEDAHPYLAEAIAYGMARWKQEYPLSPQPLVTQTHRPPAEQRALYAQGREPLDKINALRHVAGMRPINGTEARRKVTWTLFGFHCFKPALAIDIAFKTRDNTLDWTPVLFIRFHKLVIEKYPLVHHGIGVLNGEADLPHYQFKNYTIRQAKAGIDPLEGEARA